MYVSSSFFYVLLECQFSFKLNDYTQTSNMRQPYLFESDRMGVTNLSPFDKIMPALFIAELRSFNIIKENDIDIITRYRFQQIYPNRI